MAKHTGTCQHVIHPLDSNRRERKSSTGPIRIGPTRAPGFIEKDETKATPEQNRGVKPCLNCAVKRLRMSAEEASHWPRGQVPNQMTMAFNKAFYAYAQVNYPPSGQSVANGRELWNVRRCSRAAKVA